MPKHTDFLIGRKNPVPEVIDKDGNIIETFKSLDDAEIKILELCEDGEHVVIYQLSVVKVGTVSTEPTIDWEDA